MTVFMVLSSRQSHCESSSGLTNVERCKSPPSQDQARRFSESTCTGCQSLHPQSPFIIITQPQSWSSFYRRTEGRRLSTWLAGYIPRWFTRPQTVTHPGTNRVWRSATTLIETNALPLSHTANHIFTQGHSRSFEVTTLSGACVILPINISL